MNDATPQQIEADTEARWSGALKAVTKYLPHLLAIVAMGAAGLNCHNEGGTAWHSQRDGARIAALELSVSNLETEIQNIKNK